MIFFSYQSQTFVNYAPTPLKKNDFYKKYLFITIVTSKLPHVKGGRTVSRSGARGVQSSHPCSTYPLSGSQIFDM